MSDTTSKILRLAEIKSNTFSVTRDKGLDTSGVAFRDIHELWSNISGGGGGNYQTKNVIPSDVAVEVIADEGYDALAKVIVEAALNVQPWNVPEGITMFGMTGTMKVEAGTEWPDELPATEEEMDEAVTEDDADAPVEDKFVLMDNEGNVTTGYMYTEEDSGLMVYNGTVLPELPEWDYPYLVIFKQEGEGSIKDSYHLYASQMQPAISTDDFFGIDFYGVQEDCQFCYAHCYEGAEAWTINNEDETGAWSEIHGLQIWANHDVPNADETVFLAASEPTEYTGFEITHYDPATTEFRAVGWRRVSKHTTGADAGTITRDDFTRTESGGWNYLKNIRSCTREKLYYKGVEVWPNNQYMAGKWSYNGTYLPPLPDYNTETYRFTYIFAMFSEPVLAYSTTAFTHTSADKVATEGHVITHQCGETDWGDVWQEMDGQDQFPTTAIWANHDITADDGTVFLAGSDPIPV